MSQRLLSGEQEYVEPLEGGRDPIVVRVVELEDRVSLLESQLRNVKRDAVVALLNMLSDSMRHIAQGKMDIPDTPSATNSSKWEILKQKHQGTHIARAIEALQLHGRLSTIQLATNIQTSKQNAYNNVVPKLIRMGIVVRQGTDIVLREA